MKQLILPTVISQTSVIIKMFRVENYELEEIQIPVEIREMQTLFILRLAIFI